MRLAIAVLFSGLMSLAARAAEPDAALRAASSLYDGIRIERLDNGLTVVLKPIPGAGTVTTMVAYKVGAADEDLTATGLSHYLEHLMFKGTDKLMPGDIDRLTMRNGGRNNAWTNEDLTTYHFDFAADRWEVALDIEAERMRNLKIDDRHEFQQEKGAVIAELARNEDGPFDLEFKAILPRLFGKAAPYGHSVIGLREHVHGATADVIKAHYDKWYHPNNAVLVVSGGFDPDAALAKIKEKFGPIPPGKLPERKTAPPVSRTAPVRDEFPSKFEVARMVMGFNGVAGGDADEAPLDVVQFILAGGKTGRLYRELVESAELASAVSATNSAGRYPGWFGVEMEMLVGKSAKDAEAKVVAELKKLADTPVSDEELSRAKRLITTGMVFSQEGVHGLGEAIAKGVATGGIERLRSYLPRVAAVTAADVQRVAKKYLDPRTAVVVWSVPKSDGAGAMRHSPRGTARTGGTLRSAGAAGPDLKATKRVVLPNGLILLMLENHRLPIVAARAYVRDVRLCESADKAGVAQLTGSLLDEGTAKHSSQEIAALIENVGGDLSMSGSGGAVHVMAGDRELGLRLLLECLSQPSFPQDQFNRLRQEALSKIEEAEKEPDSTAALQFNALVYGQHPFGRPARGTKATVKRLTVDDCRRFHRAYFVPNRTILAVVGDFDAATVEAEVKRLTADWKRFDPPVPKIPTVEMPKESIVRIASMPEAAQLHFLMGHPGIRRNDPDYFKLLVMDYVLGTGTGFTDRLSAKLRDRMGLAYTVSANITQSAGNEVGTFTCYVGTFPDKFEAVKEGFLSEINRIRTEEPTASEVDDAKTYLLGSLPFHFATSAQVASELLETERYGLGLDYLDKFRREVAAVSPRDVMEVAKKHLHPDRMVLSAAGAVDKDGKPLAK